MNIHTFETLYPLYGKEFKTIHNDMKKYDKIHPGVYNTDIKRSNRKFFTGLHQHGIMIYLRIRKLSNERFKASLVYKINPTRLFNENDYINLFNSSDTDKLIPRVNELLGTVSVYLPHIEYCQLSRLDFCSNIELESGRQVRDFINIINRSYIDTVYEQKKLYNKKANRYSLPSDEATFTLTEHDEISCYNKNNQMLQKNLPCIAKSNILRCEIRCQKRYIDYLSKKFDVCDFEAFLNSMTEIGEYVFNEKFKQLHLTGRYMHLREIDAEIDNSNFKGKTKRKMKNVASAAAKHKMLQSALYDLSEYEKKELLHRFVTLNINPMPLPEHSSVESGSDLLDLCLRFANNKKCN